MAPLVQHATFLKDLSQKKRSSERLQIWIHWTESNLIVEIGWLKTEKVLCFTRMLKLKENLDTHFVDEHSILPMLTENNKHDDTQHNDTS